MPIAQRATRAARAALLCLAAAACTPAADGRAAAASSAAGAVATDAAATADSASLRAVADTARILGSPGAKVWLLIVSDFQCPYCKVWHDETYETLRREYVETGKVRMAYLHFPLDQHRQAEPAAEASMCAGVQGRFWPYQSALFTTQARWGKGSEPRAVYDSLARAVDVRDLPRFRSCLDSHVMRPLVRADFERTARIGVRSTPTFIVGRTMLSGAQPVNVFRQAIDAALRDSTLGAPAR